jgi:hypothetical protein
MIRASARSAAACSAQAQELPLGYCRRRPRCGDERRADRRSIGCGGRCGIDSLVRVFTGTDTADTAPAELATTGSAPTELAHMERGITDLATMEPGTTDTVGRQAGGDFCRIAHQGRPRKAARSARVMMDSDLWPE